MRVRYFGDPWPHPERRAGICDNDQFKVPVEKIVGQKCLECNEPIKANHRGVITACDMRIWGHFWLEFPATAEDFFGEEDERNEELIGRMVKMPVAAYHLGCWLREVVGGEMSEKIQKRMRLRPGDIPLTPKEIDRLEEEGLSVGDEVAEPGGWFKE